MPTLEEIQFQEDLLASHRRTLGTYLKRQSIVGAAHVSPEIEYGIIETRKNIRRVKDVLASWGVSVEDHPDDEPPFATKSIVSGWSNHPRQRIVI